MNSVKSIFIVVALGLCLIGTSSCKGKSGQKDSEGVGDSYNGSNNPFR